MNLTVLIDLDDTLLENDIDKFLPGYLKALGKHLAPKIAPERMIKELLAATDGMSAKTLPAGTLEAAFDARFYPALGISKDELIEDLTDFYTRIFTSLSPLTRPKPAAVDFVKGALAQGHTLAVATNPLFPARAIEHRLEWANLSPALYPFALITSFETFHFAKPHPAFYAECLGRLGWPAQPAVMIGNSLSDDLLPAAKLGLPGFLVTKDGEKGDLSALPPGSAQGPIEAVLDWLAETASGTPLPAYDTSSALLPILTSTPAVLDSLARQIPAELIGRPPAPGEWCFTEIICHLRDADHEINLPRLDRILSQENAFVPAINADAWAQTRDYCSEPVEVALADFCAARTGLVQRLETLSPAQWDIPANHAIFGQTTLRELATFIAQHDRTHIQQAARAVLVAGANKRSA